MSPLVTSFAVLVPALLSLGASVVYAQSTVTCGVNTVAVMDFDLRDTEIAPMTTERNYCECASRCEENRECEVFSFGVGGSVRGNCFLRRGGSPSDYTSIFFRMSDRVFSGGYDRGYIASLPSSFTSREACAEAARSNSSCNFVTIQSRPSGLFSCHMYTGDLGTGYQTGFIMGSAPSPDPPVVTTQDPPLESSSSGSPSGAETTTSLSTSQSSITVDGNTALITGAPTQIPSSTSSSLSKPTPGGNDGAAAIVNGGPSSDDSASQRTKIAVGVAVPLTLIGLVGAFALVMIRRRRRSINQKPSAPPSTVINPTSNRGGDGGGTQPGYLLSPTLAAAPSTTFGLSSSSVLNDSVMTSAVKTSGAAIYPPDRKGSSSLVQVELAPPLRSDVKRPYLDEKKSFMFSNNAIGTEYAAHDVPMRENPSREGLRGTVEVARMPTDELVAWLTSAGVASHLVEILKANNVTGFSFLVLSETKLSEMKIPATSARLIMALVNDCRRSGGGGFTHDGPSYMHRGATIAADGEAPPLYTT